MGLILCATRGGEASIPTQRRAIDLAKQSGDKLAFLYVADSSFLNKTAAAVVVDVDDELAHMGEFLLAMAAERASDRDVEAETVIRTGVVREVLPEVAKELGATTIILGRPSGEDSHFDAEGYDKFVQAIESETQAQVLSYQEPQPE
jgi:nucleotide-binding universal stress UspA family protein